MYSGKVVAFGQSGCILVKVVVIGYKWLYSGEVVVIVLSGSSPSELVVIVKVVVLGQNGCSRAKVVVFPQSGYDLAKKGCIRAKVVAFGQRWLYSGKVVLFGQSACNIAKVVVFGRKWLFSEKDVLFGQGGCIRTNWL